jgi:hypothetical protein
MTDCCISPPSIGTWQIYVKIPIYYPSRIKWNWNDGTGENIIEGDSYTVTENTADIPENIQVDVTITFTWRATPTSPINSGTVTKTVTTPIGNLFVNKSGASITNLRLSYGIGLTNNVIVRQLIGTQATFLSYSIVNIVRRDGLDEKTHTLTIKK